MFITPPEKTWVPAVIKEYLGHRSYKVQTVDGVVYRRTRLHLKPYKPQGNNTVVRARIRHFCNPKWPRCICAKMSG